jgi:hypothetical protein
MNKNCSIDVIDGITPVHYFKNPTMKDIRRFIDYAAGLNRCGLRLWDFSRSAMNLNSAQFQELAEY